jgi:hypothetical protein
MCEERFATAWGGDVGEIKGRFGERSTRAADCVRKIVSDAVPASRPRLAILRTLQAAPETR